MKAATLIVLARKTLIHLPLFAICFGFYAIGYKGENWNLDGFSENQIWLASYCGVVLAVSIWTLLSKNNGILGVLITTGCVPLVAAFTFFPSMFFIFSMQLYLTSGLVGIGFAHSVKACRSFFLNRKKKATHGG